MRHSLRKNKTSRRSKVKKTVHNSKKIKCVTILFLNPGNLEDVPTYSNCNNLFESPIHILANRCKLENVERDTKYFENMVTEFAKLSTPYNLMVKLDYTIPIKSIINKLLNNKDLNQKEIFEINNYIWNLSMDKLNEYPFDYTNPVHKGIVLTLLSYCDNDLVSPFYPLQTYPDEMPKVYEITRKWENELLRILGSV